MVNFERHRARAVVSMLDRAFRRSSASLLRTAVLEQERTALEQSGFIRAI
jgi:hypothetical protein